MSNELEKPYEHITAYDNNHLSKMDNEASDRTKEYVRASSSEATLRAYKSDLAHFKKWGGSIPSSPEQVANYLSEYAGVLSVSTQVRRLAALSKIHEVKKFDNPTKSELVRITMKGIKRTHGIAPSQKAPLTKERLIKVLDSCGDDIRGIRDRALLLIGFAGALRRSELVALDRSHVEFVPEGIIITVARSKTDQQGQGRRIGVPYAQGCNCPVKSLIAYLEEAEIREGPLFRSMDDYRLGQSRLSTHGVAYIIKHRTKECGLNPSLFSGHSLRAGFATTAARAGAQSWEIMKQTGHRSETTVRQYIRDSELFKNNVLNVIF